MQEYDHLSSRLASAFYSEDEQVARHSMSEGETSHQEAKHELGDWTGPWQSLD
jgi:hypothetical protein